MQEIDCHQGINGRFTADALLSTLGHANEPDVYQFVKNNNLHIGGKGRKGALVLINKCIGLVVQSRGSTILFKGLLPRSVQGSYQLLDLMVKDRPFGFYLQQVCGEGLGTLQAWYRLLTKDEAYPYSRDGYIYMYPGGPDVYIAGVIPEDIQTEFEKIPDNLCTRTYNKPGSKVKHLRKATTTMVCYVVNTSSRLRMENYADRFFIPVGDEVGIWNCPWANKDGSHSRYVNVS